MILHGRFHESLRGNFPACRVLIILIALSQAAWAAELPPDGLIVGVPREADFGATDAGAAQVFYGAIGTGLGLNLFWNQDQGVVPGETESGDGFGRSVISGDFNGDGSPDLAVGAPGESIGTLDYAGSVTVLYGADDGLLTDVGSQSWHQNSSGIGCCGAEADDEFGYSLAVGDFDGDHYDDLAIGVPSESLGSTIRAGGVHVLYGSSGGLTADRDQWWTQGSTGIPDDPEESDAFGHALAAGNFDGDAYDDLAIGAANENNSTGTLHVIYGAAAGLSTVGTQQFFQNDLSGPGNSIHDFFAFTLAAGNFDGDSYDDLAVGVPWDDDSGENAGGVHVLYGWSSGLGGSGDIYLHQGLFSTYGQNGGDAFGISLATGDIFGDGYDELVIGSPRVDLGDSGEIEDAGVVHVVYGYHSGLDITQRQSFDRDTPGISGDPTANDEFGDSVAVGDFDGDGHAELVISGWRADDSASNNGGLVWILPGGYGADASSSWTLHQDVFGVSGTATAGDQFGYALAVLPARVMIFRDGFESGDTSAWD